MTEPTVTVWRQEDGLWRWSWQQPGEEESGSEQLVSHKAFDSKEGAVQSAREAYPDLLLRSPAEQDGKRGCGRALLVALVVAAALTRRRSSA